MYNIFFYSNYGYRHLGVYRKIVKHPVRVQHFRCDYKLANNLLALTHNSDEWSNLKERIDSNEIDNFSCVVTSKTEFFLYLNSFLPFFLS